MRKRTREERQAFTTANRHLTEAAAKGDVAAARTLLDAEPELTEFDTAVLEACKYGQVDVLRLLLDRGAYPDVLENNSEDMSRRPLASVLGRNKNNPTWTAGHQASLELLLERGAYTGFLPGWAGHSLLTAAAAGGNAEAITWLRNRFPEPPTIFEAAALGDLDRVQALLAADSTLARARSPRADKTALTYCAHSAIGATDPAAAERLAAIANALLDAGAELSAPAPADECSYGDLQLAGRVNNEAVIAVLARRGAPPNEVLRQAIFNDLPAIRALITELQLPVDLNLIGDDRRQNTLLNETFRWGLLASAAWLLDQGADPNRPDLTGWSALHYAVRRGVNDDLIAALLAASADPLAKTKNGDTPRSIAVAKKRTSILALLDAAGG